MTYEVNHYQAERLNAALQDIHDETERYLARMAQLLTEALDEECRDGGLLSDCLADAITEQLHEDLAQVREAVGQHFNTDNTLNFLRLGKPMRRAA